MSIKKELQAEEKRLTQKTCTVCGKPAEYCMRGLPDNTYCKVCAKEYFKLLSYLDKL